MKNSNISTHKTVFFLSLISLCITTFSSENNPSIRNQENLSVGFIENQASKIESENDIVKKYDIVDSIGMAQISEDATIKNIAYKALSTIAQNNSLPLGLRRSAALQAMNSKNGSIDTIEILEYARSENLIDDSKYYGILASHFSAADDKLKINIINDLDESKNEYGKHIFLTQNKYPRHLEELSEPVVNRISKFIKSNQPIATSKTSEINIIDLNAMQGWLLLYGNTEFILKNQDPHTAISEYITKDQTDPKYAVAYILTENFNDSYLSKRPTSNIQFKFHEKLNRIIDLSKKDKVYETDLFLKKAIAKINSM